MKKQQTKRIRGRISLIFLFLVIIFLFVYSNIANPYLKDILSYVDFTLMFLYAAIPCIPAVILRATLGKDAVAKWFLIFAAAIAGLCCVIMVANALPMLTLLDNNRWIVYFSQYALISSVPILCCVALAGLGREIWAALAPSVIYLFCIILRDVAAYGLAAGILGAVNLLLSPSMIDAVLMSVIFASWAFLCVFITLIIHTVLNQPKIKNFKKSGKIIKFTAISVMVLLTPFITVLTIHSIPEAVEPVFEVSFTSDEYHGEYNFEVVQGGYHNLFINSKSRDIVVSVYITDELGILYNVTDEIISVDQQLFLEKGICTVTVDLIPLEREDEREIIPVKFDMTIKPLFDN